MTTETPKKSCLPSVVELLVIIAIIGVMLVFFCLLIGNTGAREAARRAQCTNNLKQIGLALHGYHGVYKCFPPAYIADEDGKPMHSWRVLILPFMEQQALYEQYNFDEPWNGPNNSKLHDTVIRIYSCPSEENRDRPTTSYVAVVGPDMVFSGCKATTIGDITDGTSKTLLAVELADSGIHWMEPRDLTVEEIPFLINPGEGRSQGISSMHPGGAQVALGDGSVRFLGDNLPTKTLRAMLTIAGGEAIDSRP